MKEILLKEQRAIVHLPENAVKVTISVVIYENDTIETVEKVLNLSEIRKAFADAEENYIEEEDTFTLTDKGKQMMKSTMGIECGLTERNLVDEDPWEAVRIRDWETAFMDT